MQLKFCTGVFPNRDRAGTVELLAKLACSVSPDSRGHSVVLRVRLRQAAFDLRHAVSSFLPANCG